MAQFDERYEMKVKAAYMCYIQDKTQADAAKALGISRPTLGKLLREAREEGIVKIEIRDAKRLTDSLALEEALRRRYGLREARVALCENAGMALAAIGQAAGEYLGKAIQPGMRVGVAWGRTLQAAVDYMARYGRAGAVEFVPLLGGPRYSSNCRVFANSISEKMAACYPGSTVAYLYSPLLAQSEADAAAILATDAVKGVFRKMEQLDMAIVGIDGDPTHSTSVDAMELDGESLLASGAVGNVCTRFFDIDGNRCDLEIDRRVIAIAPEVLKRTPVRIGVAGGAHKARSIESALKGGLVNVLVTDEMTARCLV